MFIGCCHARLFHNSYRRQNYLVERVDQMDHFELNPWYQVRDRQEQLVEHIYHLKERARERERERIETTDRSIMVTSCFIVIYVDTF